MKRSLSLFLSMALSLSLAVPAASAAGAGGITLKEKYKGVGAVAEEAYWVKPEVTDLDGDGKLEVITAAYTLTVADAATGSTKWKTPKGPMGIFSGFLVKDLDGDGKKEIAVAYGNGSAAVYDSRGAVKAGWPKQVANNIIWSLAADDVDGDGKQELIFGVGVPSWTSLYVYSCGGELKPGWPQRTETVNGVIPNFSAGIYSNGISTGDLDGDGLPEIVMPTDNYFIQAYNGDGTMVKAGPRFQTTQFFDPSGTAYWGNVGAYEGEAEELARENAGFGFYEEPYARLADRTRKDLYRPSFSSARTIFADVDGDGKKEILSTMLVVDSTKAWSDPSNPDVFTAADGKYMSVFILNSDRTRFKTDKYDWTRFPTNETVPELGGPLNRGDTNSMWNSVQPSPLVADVNGDGVNEILFNAFDGKVHCFSLKDSGRELAGWPYKLPGTTASVFEFAAEPVAADVNGDGKPEVVFVSRTVNGQNSEATGVNGSIYIVDGSGKLLVRQALPAGIGGSNGSFGAPTVADIDGDGQLEILVNSRRFGLCAYDVITAGPQQPARPTGTGFTDVSPNAYYADAVKWAVKKGITNGTANNTFAPDDTCTQVQIVTFLWRGVNKPASTARLPFTPKNSYAAQALCWAYEKGMIDASFDENAPCTRAGAVKFIWQAQGSPAVTATDQFTDVPAGADYAAAVAWAVEKGITKGTSAATFGPGETCRRGQIVTFLHRAYVK